MKMQVLGAKVLKGQKDGNDWDMSSILVQTKIESFQNQRVTVTGYGFEVTEMPLDPSCIEQFKNIQFPALVDLDIGQRARMGKFESYVVGVLPVLSVARQA
ncbi:MAG: hypothetical protein B7X79_16145 [Acidovorax sp. 17-64-282]|uniref:hypothetical protein n=1 Tax=Acidovorax sp. TaxID=1872122 RepID=UPI000BCB01F7|nr:hypothetical protein [Acidovorax sp.]OZA55096.1 MAG: hypothetical protein B7X79_16145 [Acidovorax sp. 17-64-282]